MLNELINKFSTYSEMNNEELKKELANIKTRQLNLQKIGEDIDFEDETNAMIVLSMLFSTDTDIDEIVKTKREIEEIAEKQSECL